MKNRLKFLGIIVAVAVIGFSMTGCASVSDIRFTYWDHMLVLPDHEDIRDYTVLGVVQVEERRTIVLGTFLGEVHLPLFPRPIGGGSMQLLRFTRGEATYSALLRAARRQFPNANAVIGVQVDRVQSSFLFFTASRTYILTGLAVEFAAEPPMRRE